MRAAGAGAGESSFCGAPRPCHEIGSHHDLRTYSFGRCAHERTTATLATWMAGRDHCGMAALALGQEDALALGRTPLAERSRSACRGR